MKIGGKDPKDRAKLVAQVLDSTKVPTSLMDPSEAEIRKAADLTKYWRQCWAHRYGTEWQADWTQVQKSQASQLIRMVPGDTLEDRGQLVACIVWYSMRSWMLLARHIGETQGIKNFPSRPNIAFILKHRGPVVNWTLDQIKAGTPDPVQSIAHNPLAAAAAAAWEDDDS